MRNSRLSLLVVATVVATILVAGCTSSNQQSSSSQGTSTPSTSTSVATSSSVASASPTVRPSASASPTAATPTSAPSGKIATSIDGTPSFNSNPTITRNQPVTGWGFEVVPTGQAQVLSVPVTVRIDNKAIGQVTPLSGGTATAAFSLTSAETNSLAVGQHTLTVSFAGDSTYQPSEQSFQITVTTVT